MTFGQILSQLNETYRSERLIKVYETPTSLKKSVSVTSTVGWKGWRCVSRSLKASVLLRLSSSVSAVLRLSSVWHCLKQKGQLSLAEFVTYISAMLLMMPAIRKLAGLNADCQYGRDRRKPFEMIDIPSTKDPGSKSIERVKGNVEFKNVWYKYPNALEPSLKDFSLKARPERWLPLWVLQARKLRAPSLTWFLVSWCRRKERSSTDGIPQNRECTGEHSPSGGNRDSGSHALWWYHCCQYCFQTEDPWQEEIMRAAKPPINAMFASRRSSDSDWWGRIKTFRRPRVSVSPSHAHSWKDAPILLLDEATSALDTEKRKVHSGLFGQTQRRPHELCGGAPSLYPLWMPIWSSWWIRGNRVTERRFRTGHDIVILRFNSSHQKPEKSETQA